MSSEYSENHQYQINLKTAENHIYRQNKFGNSGKSEKIPERTADPETGTHVPHTRHRRRYGFYQSHSGRRKKYGGNQKDKDIQRNVEH